MGFNVRSLSALLFAATGLAAASCESSDSSSGNPPVSFDSGQFTTDSAVPSETGVGVDASIVDAADAGSDAAHATSCKGTLPANCRTPATDDCCATLPVPAGSFTRSQSGTAWSAEGANETVALN